MSGTACSNHGYTTMTGLRRPNNQVMNGSSSSRSEKQSCSFQMPLHYPRYKKADYDTMPEWKLDCLLTQYGLSVTGDVAEKRKFAMGAFLWPSQNH